MNKDWTWCFSRSLEQLVKAVICLVKREYYGVIKLTDDHDNNRYLSVDKINSSHIPAAQHSKNGILFK